MYILFCFFVFVFYFFVILNLFFCGNMMSDSTVKVYDSSSENKKFLLFGSKYINKNCEIETFDYPIQEHADVLLKELSANGVIFIKNTDENFKQECLKARQNIGKRLEKHNLVQMNTKVNNQIQ